MRFQLCPYLQILVASLVLQTASQAADPELFAFPPLSAPALVPLRLPESATEQTPSSPQMALYKPAGDGPFPAIVLSPTCAGVSPHMTYWAKEAMNAGYVVLVLDHMGQRNVGNICGRRSELTFGQGSKDALAALDYLGNFAFVDKAKIGFMGYSWGGAIALLVSSKSIAEDPRFAGASKARYAAAVAMYPACYHPAWGNVPELAFMRPDTDRPLLALLPENDHEEPVAECVKRFAAIKSLGGPVQWYVIPNATHAFDKAEADGRSSKMPWMPSGGRYSYSAAATQDARDRAFAFFRETFAH